MCCAMHLKDRGGGREKMSVVSGSGYEGRGVMSTSSVSITKVAKPYIPFVI